MVCLQEINGIFGPRVLAHLPNYPNVIIKCSSSGKMTKELVNEFNIEIIKPYFKTNFVYIADSWSGQTNLEIYENIFENKCTFLRIPPRCTSLIQPLDVYFFRFWKMIAKRIYNEVALHEWEIELKDRNQIIKLHSLIHNQLSAPIFRNMIIYSWFRSGYLTPHFPFKDISEICFPTTLDDCQQHECYRPAFISCSFCKQELCLEHFFVSYHSHFDNNNV